MRDIPIFAILKGGLGMILFLLLGGAQLVILGILPIGSLAALISFLTAIGIPVGGTISILVSLGLLGIAVFLPITLISAAWIDQAVDEVFGFSFGVSHLVGKGVHALTRF